MQKLSDSENYLQNLSSSSLRSIYYSIQSIFIDDWKYFLKK